MKKSNLSYKSEYTSDRHLTYSLYRKGVLVLCHVNICLLFAQTSELSVGLFASLKEDFLSTGEVEADRCIGVEIKTTDDASTLKQSQLIKRTIKILGLIDANPMSVPVAKVLLGKHRKDREGDRFNCRSAVSLL